MFYFHQDALSNLNGDAPIAAKLANIHGFVRKHMPFVARIAVALYDAPTDTLKTYAHSGEGDNPLPFYEARLGDSASLREIVQRGQPRVVNDIDLYGEAAEHSKQIRGGGFGSSYTLPIFHNGDLLGFLFFNSYEKGVFTDTSLHFFDLLAHLLALVVADGLATPTALMATVRTLTGLAQHRDFETGTHLDRMAHYARIIAREIAPKYGLTDADVEQIFLYSPLHDIGKIAIPDDILLKNGKLTDAEFEVMKTHAVRGFEIIDDMLNNFHLDGTSHSGVLRNIALYHHETMDGSGYPSGRKGDDIPIEARVAGVADVFDALTSRRPYKHAWPIDEAFQFLIENADTRFDRDCVAALVKHRADVERIQAQFGEDHVG
ncbi:MAG: HD domain-containing protein [Rhodocyclaceae bacterium]|nr:HD domain-containing protein [Rhodocyclaceae bacterium]